MEVQRNTPNEKRILFSGLLVFSLFNQAIIATTFLLKYYTVISVDQQETINLYATIISAIITLLVIVFNLLTRIDSIDVTSNLLNGYHGYNTKSFTKKIFFILMVSCITGSFFAQIAWIGLLFVSNQDFLDPHWFNVFFEELSRLALLFGLIGGIGVSGLIPTIEEKKKD